MTVKIKDFTADIPCTLEEWEAFMSGMVIQNAMPDVPAHIRELLLFQKTYAQQALEENIYVADIAQIYMVRCRQCAYELTFSRMKAFFKRHEMNNMDLFMKIEGFDHFTDIPTIHWGFEFLQMNDTDHISFIKELLHRINCLKKLISGLLEN